MAGDTRSSSGYNINTRLAKKIFDVGSGVVLGAVGFSADCEELARRVRRRIEVNDLTFAATAAAAAPLNQAKIYKHSWLCML